MVSWILQLKGFNLKYDIEYLNNGTSVLIQTKKLLLMY